MNKNLNAVLFPLALVAGCLIVSSCGDTRRFGGEYDAISHFQGHSQDFSTMALACEQSGVSSVRVAEDGAHTGSSATDHDLQKCLRLARQLSVSQIDVVPRRGRSDEQYLEFALPGTSFAPYGFIFVPHGHSAALSTVKSEIGPPLRVYRVMHQIADQWFYYEYQ